MGSFFRAPNWVRFVKMLFLEGQEINREGREGRKGGKVKLYFLVIKPVWQGSGAGCGVGEAQIFAPIWN